MKKIKMKINNTVEETFEYFIVLRKASGLSKTTIVTYNQHSSAIKRHLNNIVNIEKMCNPELCI